MEFAGSQNVVVQRGNRDGSVAPGSVVVPIQGVVCLVEQQLPMRLGRYVACRTDEIVAIGRRTALRFEAIGVPREPRLRDLHQIAGGEVGDRVAAMRWIQVREDIGPRTSGQNVRTGATR